jgi:hypothetical protein
MSHIPLETNVLNVPWIVLYFVSVAIIFAAVVFSLVTHLHCNAPPILGFVSSLLRDWKCFEDIDVDYKGSAQDNSIEDGQAKTKRFGKLKVQVADIRGDDNVGRIAFASVQEGLRVCRNRLYT